jgi:hypothetical protein
MKVLIAIFFFVSLGLNAQDYFPFNNSASNQTGGLTGVLQNSATYNTTYKIEGTHALDLNQSSTNRFLTGSKDMSSGPRTIAFWAYSRKTYGSRSILSTNQNSTGASQGYRVIWDYDFDRLMVGMHNGSSEDYSYTGTNSVLINNGYYIVIVWLDINAANVRIYINGTLANASDSVALSGAGKTGPISFGCSMEAADYSMRGYIDQLQIWDCALTQTQISSLYASVASNYTFACPSEEPEEPAVTQFTDVNKIIVYDIFTSDAISPQFPPEGPSEDPEWVNALYVDAISGSDDSAGTTKIKAIKTLAKANTMYSTFDVIALTDTVHYGALSVNNWDGTVGNEKQIVTWHKHGQGRAKINGTKALTSWTSLGGNKWSITDTDLSDNTYKFYLHGTGKINYAYFLNVLMINGQRYGIGKYPNTGALSVSTVAPDLKSYIIDNELGATTNQWQNAWIYITPVDWVPDKALITSNTSTQLNLRTSDLPFYNFTNNVPAWGQYLKYNIINHPNACDQNGEWAYDVATNTITLYHTTNPSALDIRVSVYDSVLNVSNSENLIIKGIELQSANWANLLIKSSNGVYVDSCMFKHSGHAAALVTNSQNVYFRYDSILYAGSNGIDFEWGTGTGVEHVQHCYISGDNKYYFGDRDGQNYQGITSRWGTGSKNFAYNEVRNFGYNGIGIVGLESTPGLSRLVYRNYVDGWCQHLTDGGAIYMSTQPESSVSKIIRGNILNASGTDVSFNRTHSQNFAIYLDEGSKYYLVDSNTVINTSTGTFGNFSTDNNKWRRNTFVIKQFTGDYVNYRSAFIKAHYPDNQAFNVTFARNDVVVMDAANTMGFTFYHDGTPQATRVDSNNYYNPFRTDGLMFRGVVTGGTATNYTLAGWNAFSGFEAHGTSNQSNHFFQDVTGVTASQFVYVFSNWSPSSHTFNLGTTVYESLTGVDTSGSLVVPPYQTRVLFYKSGGVPSFSTFNLYQ